MSSDLIIFDCDGVLVDSEPISNRVIVDLLAEAGWILSEDDSQRRFRGRRMDDVIAQIETHLGRPLPRDWLSQYEERRNAAFRQSLKPIPGIARVLACVAELNRPMCVASSGSIAKTRMTLGLTGLASFFGDRLYSSSGLANGKPAPDLFLHAAAAMGFDPPQCVVIEDSLPGVQAAQAAGMRCFGYAADSDSEALKACGATCFTDMAALPGLLGLA
ncbi:MAG: HAD family hydrolase [Rhodospirillaceae bacterium]|nr:MAG: HAD family hydrolase [Rhodospirillaceae bacterium]